MKRTTFATAGIAALAFATLAAPAPAEAQYRQKITNDAAKCAAGAGPEHLIICVLNDRRKACRSFINIEGVSRSIQE